MSFVQPIIYNVAILFIMMVPGIILKKCNMIKDGFGKGLSNLVLYIAQPALIFLAYLKDYDKEIMINALFVLLFSAVAHGIFSVVTLLAFKKAPDAEGRMLKFATIFSNAAFMGIPLISAVLEDTYPGATLYASIYNVIFNLCLWSLGVYICNAGRDGNNNGIDDFQEVFDFTPDIKDIITGKKNEGSISILKAILHPVTITAIIGFLFFILPINSYVPDILLDSLGMLKGLVAPLSMTVIGLRLADMNFKGVLKDKLMYVFIALRHFILPLAVIGIFKLTALCGLDLHPAVILVVVIMAAAPAATSATMFAEMFDCDSVYVSRLVTISTILSIATMPLILMLV